MYVQYNTHPMYVQYNTHPMYSTTLMHFTIQHTCTLKERTCVAIHSVCEYFHIRTVHVLNYIVHVILILLTQVHYIHTLLPCTVATN